MSRYACPFCSALTEIPDDWPHPGFTCSVCHRPVPFAPGMGPGARQHVAAEASDPHFIPVVPPRPWGWTPWFVVLLGGAAMGSVVAYLVTADDFWLLAVGAPAVGLLALLAVVWIILGGRPPEPPAEEPPADAA